MVAFLGHYRPNWIFCPDTTITTSEGVKQGATAAVSRYANGLIMKQILLVVTLMQSDLLCGWGGSLTCTTVTCGAY